MDHSINLYFWEQSDINTKLQAEIWIQVKGHLLNTHTPCWRSRRGQRKRRGCSQHSSSSTAWCPCLHSTGQCSWEGGRPAAGHARHPDSTATPNLAETEGECGNEQDRVVGGAKGRTKTDGKRVLTKTNGQQHFSVHINIHFLHSLCGRPINPVQQWEPAGLFKASLTLDWFGVLLDLTVGGATDHIPHDDLPWRIARRQAQAVGRAQVVVIVFFGPFYLPKTEQR